MENTTITSMDHFTRTVSIDTGKGTIVRSYQLAGAGARSLAGLVDLVLQAVIFIGIAWAAVKGRPDLFPREAWPWALPVAFIEWHIIYLMLFESFTGGLIPGKALLGLRVVDATGLKLPAWRLVSRNVLRVLELVMGFYIVAFLRINATETRQRLGDRYAGTIVIYNIPLFKQLHASEVPESLYSTSEDGYLLQAWIEREQRFDAESKIASAIDLAAWLHSKYDAANEELPDPVTYLRELYEAEKQHHHHENTTAGNEIAKATIGSE